MKLAKAMNSENDEELPSEFCFSDGKVKRTKSFTTLTASCYNPFLQKHVPLAVMMCTKDDKKKYPDFGKSSTKHIK